MGIITEFILKFWKDLASVCEFLVMFLIGLLFLFMIVFGWIFFWFIERGDGC